MDHRKSSQHEYEEHLKPVMRMLAKRFPRFAEDDRLSIYHDAWARVLAKRQRGEVIESLRAYLLATCAAEALHIVSRTSPPIPVAPDEPLFTNRSDDTPDVEEQVVARDQARLARNLIDSLDERQRQVLKLRWDLQLTAPEVRAALGLSKRQYQRLTEEGAAAIAKRVEELKDGTLSRRQRSLLTACLVEVGSDGERQVGIANEHQRKEAQRLIESDPHAAALFHEVRNSLKRGAAILPLPVLTLDSDASGFSRLGDVLADAANATKQQTLQLYVRVADPSLATVPRPGAILATAAGCLVIGGGAVGTYEATSSPEPVTAGVDAASSIQPLIRTPAVVASRPKTTTRSEPSKRPPAPTPTQVAAEPAPPPPPPAPTPTPQPEPSEFGFEK